MAREVVSIQPQVSGRITESIRGRRRRQGRRPAVHHRPAALPGAARRRAGELAERRGLDLARSESSARETLLGRKAISQSDYDLRKNGVDVAQAEVAQAAPALETARLNLEYCTIRSPIDGRAGQRLVDLGNVVTANSGSLLVIQRLDPIYADFTVPRTI